MMHKPDWWRNNRLNAPDRNEGASRTWRELNSESTSTQQDDPDSGYDNRPTQIVRIKITTTAERQRPEVVIVHPKLQKSDLNDKSSSSSLNSFPNSMIKALPTTNGCIFKENQDPQLSPIKKPKTSFKLSDHLRRKFFGLTPVAPTPEGKIVKEIVFDRFKLDKNGKTMNRREEIRQPIRIKHSSPIKDRKKYVIRTIQEEGEELPVMVKVQQYPEVQRVCRTSMEMTAPRSSTTDSISTISSDSTDEGLCTAPRESPEISSFNQEKFLVQALGDEMNSTFSKTVTQPIEANVIILEVKDSKESSFVSTTQNRVSSIQNTIGTEDASELVSRRCVTQATGTDSTDGAPEIPTDSSDSDENKKTGTDSPTDSDDTVKKAIKRDQKINDLMKLASEQHFHMQQASKAITLCRVTKEFTCSSERLEAERLLLLAVLKNRSVMEEVNWMETPYYNENVQQGEVTISDIRIAFNPVITESIQHNFDNYTQWYVCVGMYGSQVHMSKVLIGSGAGEELIFPEEMKFVKLHPNFNLEIQIYVFELPKNIKSFSHMSRYHLNENYSCPTPKKLFKKHLTKQTPPPQAEVLNDYIRTPSFKLAGSVKICLEDIRMDSSQPQFRALYKSHEYFKGIIGMIIATNLQIYVRSFGFLTMRSEAGGYPSWSRYWCLLEGHSIKYWNYPADADSKPPAGSIDLQKCVSTSIDVASPEICMKPRTLLLETIRLKEPTDEDSLMYDCHDDYTIIRHFLHCDDDRELKKWSKQLNLIVSFFTNWNITEQVP